MRARYGIAFALTLLFAFASTPTSAQQGAILARVTEGATGRPLPTVQVAVSGGGTQVGGITDENGQIRVNVPPGSYTVTFTVVGYQTETSEGVQVTAGETTMVGVAMESRVYSLEEIVISGNRQLQKKVDQPTGMATVNEQTISERPVTTHIDHLYSVRGVDIIRQGAQSANVVVRGFNNIFSGALHALTDNRIAGVPSLRVNLLHFIPANDDDVARMEVVLGPGSALYGPNTANGVLHVITKSPLNTQETTASVAGGERDFLKGMFRTSHLLNDDFGIKVSGQFMRGVDWRFRDPFEVEALEDTANLRLGLQLRGVPQDEIELAISRVGRRDQVLQRFGGEVRADWRVSDEATWIFQTGHTVADGIELTGIGAGQTEDWWYSYYQTRFNWNRFFAQVYLNKSDAGDSYLVRQGLPLADNSELLVGQLQHGFAAGSPMADGQARQDFTYGLDVFLTTPKTDGRVNGQYEDDDEIDEVGGYIQSQTALTDQLDLVAALRVDDSSVLEDLIWSPRAALVFKPDENQSLRFTYNRAFSTPTTLNYFLDINAGLAAGGAGDLGFFQRAQGPGLDGIRLQQPDGSIKVRLPTVAGMIPGLPAPGSLVDPDPQHVWAVSLAGLLGQGFLTPEEFQQLLQVPMTGAEFNLLNPIDESQRPLDGATIPGAPRLKESTTETFEVGYTGVLADRVSIAADVWYSEREDFTSPLIPRTPLLTLQADDVLARLLAAQIPEQRAQLIAGGVNRIPGAVVSSEDIVTGTADVVASYLNFGEVDMWGWDLGFQAFLDDAGRWSLDGNVSWVSDDFFVVSSETDKEVEDPGEIEEISEVLTLNAPDFKGSLGVGFRDETVTAEGRYRFTSEFPGNSADFVGLACLPGVEETEIIRDCVDDAQLFDLLLGYRLSGTGTEIQLNVRNLFNDGHQSFVGVPRIGRLALLQVKHTF